VLLDLTLPGDSGLVVLRRMHREFPAIPGLVVSMHPVDHVRTHPQEGRTVAFAQCDLTLNGDRMTGRIDTDKGTIEFVRVPSK